MLKYLLTFLACLLFAGMAQAEDRPVHANDGQPVVLAERQLDTVTAGFNFGLIDFSQIDFSRIEFRPIEPIEWWDFPTFDWSSFD